MPASATKIDTNHAGSKLLKVLLRSFVNYMPSVSHITLFYDRHDEYNNDEQITSLSSA